MGKLSGIHMPKWSTPIKPLYHARHLLVGPGLRLAGTLHRGPSRIPRPAPSFLPALMSLGGLL